MSNNKCSLKKFDGSKMLYGTAAILSFISEEGGWDAYHENLVHSITSKVIDEVVPKVYNEIMEDMSRPRLRAVK